MNTCTKCKKRKEDNEFRHWKSSKTGVIFYNPVCKLCHNARSRELYKNNRDARRASHKKWYLKNHETEKAKAREKHKRIKRARYDELFELQKGKCAICKKPETASREGRIKDLAMDHNHKTGKIRELLCQRCNVGLGNANDSIKRLKQFIRYLEKHR